MFGPDLGQEVASLVIASFALLFVIQKISGWPTRKKKATGPPVAVGDRLARGLRAAAQRDESRRESP